MYSYAQQLSKRQLTGKPLTTKTKLDIAERAQRKNWKIASEKSYNKYQEYMQVASEQSESPESIDRQQQLEIESDQLHNISRFYREKVEQIENAQLQQTPVWDDSFGDSYSAQEM